VGDRLVQSLVFCGGSFCSIFIFFVGVRFVQSLFFCGGSFCSIFSFVCSVVFIIVYRFVNVLSVNVFTSNYFITALDYTCGIFNLY
jgi:hypothetical protein